jgi:adenylosuccinate lyase
LPQAFLIADEALRRGLKLIKGVTINTRASQRLMDLYGPFAATERLLMEAVKRGGDRQHLHEVIREHSLSAWATTRDGGDNPLIDNLVADKDMLSLASAAEIRGWLDATHYVGDAPERSIQMAQEMREAINEKA